VYGTNDDPNVEGVTPNWVAQGAMNVDYSYDYIHADSVATDTIKGVIGLGATLLSDAYRYIRFDLITNLRSLNNEAASKDYFAFSEFGVWAATEDLEAVTLLSEVPAAVKETLVAELNKSKAELNAGLATKAQIETLAAAYEEFLKMLPEPTRLTDAIAAIKELSANAPIGADASYYPEAAKGALDAVIAEV
jgi:hypothetical protein